MHDGGRNEQHRSNTNVVLSMMGKKHGKRPDKNKPVAPGQPEQSRWVRWLYGLFIFVLGALLGPILYQWFIETLPGPGPLAEVKGIRPMSGNGVGCTYYTLSFVSDDPIDDIYMKIQFPTQIENFFVGFPVEGVTSGAGRVAMQAWELGKNSKGECAVIQAALNNNADVTTAAAGNMISIHASKLPPTTIIAGIVATTDNKSRIKPPPSMYTEGAYEYAKIGQTVRKPLMIVNQGIVEQK